ncbi:MAG TPA: hypothetical protein VF975_06995 [Thermoanaerobaculia bacterium]
MSPDGGTIAPVAQPAAVYNKETGRLEQLVSDRDGDGKADTRASMDGNRLLKIEIDRDNDGRVDRWEYYGEAPTDRVIPGSPVGRAEIQRVDEADGAGDRVTRREFYEQGQLRRVEDDSDANGRTDRWEFYENGLLARIELDAQGRGFADRRFFYRRDGSIERVDVNPKGDGTWSPARQPAASHATR